MNFVIRGCKRKTSFHKSCTSIKLYLLPGFSLVLRRLDGEARLSVSSLITLTWNNHMSFLASNPWNHPRSWLIMVRDLLWVSVFQINTFSSKLGLISSLNWWTGFQNTELHAWTKCGKRSANDAAIISRESIWIFWLTAIFEILIRVWEISSLIEI